MSSPLKEGRVARIWELRDSLGTGKIHPQLKREEKGRGGVKLVARLLGLEKDYCTLELMPI